MAGRPPAGATFEVERIGRRRSTGSLAAVGLVAILAGCIGIAVLDRGAGAAAIASSEASPAATDAAAQLAGGPTVIDSGTATSPIHLVSPPLGATALATAILTVSGTVSVRSDHVEVALQGRNEHTVAQFFVDISSAWDVLRPDVSPSFRVDFDLRAPRRVGTMWVEVTVFDAANRVLAYDRRSFVVGPIKGA